jgi:hypothetical protein
MLEYASTTGLKFDLLQNRNCVGGVMVGVLALSAVDCGLEPRSGQTKDYKIGICCFRNIFSRN